MKLPKEFIQWNANLTQTGGTPNWAVELGQSSPDYPMIKDGFSNIINGLVYNKIEDYKTDFKYGGGGTNYEFKIVSLFKKIIIKSFDSVTKSISEGQIDYPFIVLLVKELKGQHQGRFKLKANKEFEYKNYKNESFYNEIDKSNGISVPWFAYMIDYDVLEGYLKITIIQDSKNSGKIYQDTFQRKTIFNKLIRDYESADSFHILRTSGQEIKLSKPFILLAGISGTGKTRFIKKQAERAAELYGLSKDSNYCLIPVRPDWHEPSDILGYISRIGGTKYIVTDFLIFIVKAIVASTDDVINNEIHWRNFDNVPPFWLCLDEMNLAPVEQYFSDYLAVLESREWKNGKYSIEALLKASIIQQLKSVSDIDIFWENIFEDCNPDIKVKLSNYFEINGIPIPPNLIVAGTVNMDETTHGFSRKVIDRALTLDFQEFFPNDYDKFFKVQLEPKLLSYPTLYHLEKDHLLQIEQDDEILKSIEFLKKINGVLKNTSFELAFRSLNELLISVYYFGPYTGQIGERKLQAVWDDYLMQKVLPRIEGDNQKLKYFARDKANIYKSDELDRNESIYGKETILHQLYSLLAEEKLSEIWGLEEELNQRPDLLQNNEDFVECRSRKKLQWMMKRLKSNHFTDFWV